jgi:hypothetical protein
LKAEAEAKLKAEHELRLEDNGLLYGCATLQAMSYESKIKGLEAKLKEQAAAELDTATANGIDAFYELKKRIAELEAVLPKLCKYSDGEGGISGTYGCSYVSGKRPVCCPENCPVLKPSGRRS